VSEPAPLRDRLRQHHWRLAVYLRALLPTASDAEAALRETVVRIGHQADRAPDARFAEWAQGIARQVAADRRKTLSALPFSDDLFRQLADSAGPILDQSDERPAALARILDRLPPPERDLLRRRYSLGLTAEQMAAAESRPTAAMTRELTALHGSLVLALREEHPDTGPEPPGGASDLGRLADQLLDGTITNDGRLVLETLLLADAAAQAHYHRHAALATELSWKYAGPPALPDLPRDEPARRVTAREWAVTAAFLVAVLAVIAFAALRLYGYL
jgi:DNA-directed RNA polymerase specialized sigma24 family protein